MRFSLKLLVLLGKFGINFLLFLENSLILPSSRSKENYELFANSLKKDKAKLEKECKCEVSEKPRTPYYDSENYGYAYCEMCETRIAGAGKHGVIKNRNDPRFWGLNIKEKVLCGDCLESKKENMLPLRKAEFNRYRKVGRL